MGQRRRSNMALLPVASGRCRPHLAFPGSRTSGPDTPAARGLAGMEFSVGLSWHPSLHVVLVIPSVVLGLSGFYAFIRQRGVGRSAPMIPLGISMRFSFFYQTSTYGIQPSQSHYLDADGPLCSGLIRGTAGRRFRAPRRAVTKRINNGESHPRPQINIHRCPASLTRMDTGSSVPEAISRPVRSKPCGRSSVQPPSRQCRPPDRAQRSYQRVSESFTLERPWLETKGQKS